MPIIFANICNKDFFFMNTVITRSTDTLLSIENALHFSAATTSCIISFSLSNHGHKHDIDEATQSYLAVNQNGLFTRQYIQNINIYQIIKSISPLEWLKVVVLSHYLSQQKTLHRVVIVVLMSHLYSSRSPAAAAAATTAAVVAAAAAVEALLLTPCQVQHCSLKQQ